MWAKEKEHFINADTPQDLEDIGRSNGNGGQRSKLMQQQMTEVGSMMYLRQELPKSSKATVKPTSYCILSMETCFKWLSITH